MIRDMLRNYIECNMVSLFALAEALGAIHASSHRRKRSVPLRPWNFLETSAAVHVSLQMTLHLLSISVLFNSVPDPDSKITTETQDGPARIVELLFGGVFAALED